ncbi:ATP-binding cassette domain-containing protein [Aeromonas caviae]|uniref:ATP-binding cassette domain-containing protein n=1 Tax=Aeromonas caviae TaxID=648 RepID=UPI0008528855|nr:ATP-binding cassette domain-containing protein [Aeromonas caviae]OEG04560.1 hypothetical protein BFG06_05440 [Aeromonas caviae]
MTSLQWQSATLALRGHRTLVIPELCLTPQACWAFVGSNGSGKTALASALCGELTVRAGAVSGRVRADTAPARTTNQLTRIYASFFQQLGKLSQFLQALRTHHRTIP